MTITEFLLARIAEDEAVATAAREWVGMHWDSTDSEEWEAFDDRFDPARVLAEGEAKRRIVDLHSGTAPWCGWTHDAGSAHGDDMGDDCDTMRALASVYADHPDYREEWRA